MLMPSCLFDDDTVILMMLPLFLKLITQEKEVYSFNVKKIEIRCVMASAENAVNWPLTFWNLNVDFFLTGF